MRSRELSTDLNWVQFYCTQWSASLARSLWEEYKITFHHINSSNSATAVTWPVIHFFYYYHHRNDFPLSLSPASGAVDNEAAFILHRVDPLPLLKQTSSVCAERCLHLFSIPTLNVKCNKLSSPFTGDHTAKVWMHVANTHANHFLCIYPLLDSLCETVEWKERRERNKI